MWSLWCRRNTSNKHRVVVIHLDFIFFLPQILTSCLLAWWCLENLASQLRFQCFMSTMWSYTQRSCETWQLELLPRLPGWAASLLLTLFTWVRHLLFLASCYTTAQRSYWSFRSAGSALSPFICCLSPCCHPRSEFAVVRCRDEAELLGHILAMGITPGTPGSFLGEHDKKWSSK